MHDGNTCRICRMSHKSKMDKGVKCIEKDHECNRTDHVKVQMYHSRTFSILFSSHSGEKRGHTSTDILSHDNGDGNVKAHRPCHTECLQNTHRRGRTLDNCCEDRTCDHAQDGVGKLCQNTGEFRYVRQRLHSAAHTLHTKHKHRKSNKYHANVFFLLTFGKHKESDTHNSQDG